MPEPYWGISFVLVLLTFILVVLLAFGVLPT